LSLVYSGSIAATAPSYTAQCVAAEQAHATALIVNDSAQPILRAASDCNQQGYDPTYVTLAEGDGASMVTSPGISKNNYITFADYPFLVNTSVTKAFDAAVDKYYPGLRNQTTTFLGSTGQTWVAGLLLEAAVKAGGLTASGTPSASEITAGLQSLKAETLDGWSSPLTFTPNQANPVNCWFTSHIQNGTATVINNGKATCLNS
jgi:branched-chain amino acid transport system substrate-binding protein